MIPELEKLGAEQDAEELSRRNPRRRYDPVPVLPAQLELDRLLPKVR